MKRSKPSYNAIDLFCGCGGLTQGLKSAGFQVVLAVDNSQDAISSYKLNHPDVPVLTKDIRKLSAEEIRAFLGKSKLHLLAGCPPCQGFSSVRRHNKSRSIRDSRNALLLEFLRIVKAVKPETIMLENVPGIVDYFLFSKLLRGLWKAGYWLDYRVVNAADYGVPQRRRRFILVGSHLGQISVRTATGPRRTVRSAIGLLEDVRTSKDPLHKITAKHTAHVQDLIKKIPKNGGSWTDIPRKYWLKCHQKKGIGFKDIYGRLSWNTVSSTITGGCLNPSKGRFLHPEKNRTITPREAALLQTFPKKYRFPAGITRTSLASLIGNALPPRFSQLQSEHIQKHLEKSHGRHFRP